jgi:hypothetical protein
MTNLQQPLGEVEQKSQGEGWLEPLILGVMASLICGIGDALMGSPVVSRGICERTIEFDTKQ